MEKFIFLLTIWNVPGQADVVEVYPQAITSPAACSALMVAYNRENPQWGAGTPSCELETAKNGFRTPDFEEFEVSGETYAIGPCFVEDSQNCYWDAETHGNGKGKSFFDIGGKLYTWEK